MSFLPCWFEMPPCLRGLHPAPRSVDEAAQARRIRPRARAGLAEGPSLGGQSAPLVLQRYNGFH